MTVLQARILHIGINAPFDAAYDYAHRPESFPKWAAGLSQTLRQAERGWIAQAPEGEAVVEFTGRNPFGVMDHRVRMEGRPVVYVPLRMLANGDGVEVELVLFRQPGMTDEMFERDAGLVQADLAALKALLEGACGRSTDR